MDGGATWGSLISVVEVGDDFQVVVEANGTIHVQFTPDCNAVQPNCNRFLGEGRSGVKLVQVTSRDLGLTWTQPAAVVTAGGKPALGQWDGLLVGPGAAIQLRPTNPHHPNRYCISYNPMQ